MDGQKKRKTTTSTAVKRRYNEKMYSVISFSAPKEMAAAFKAKCAEKGEPQAQVLKRAIEAYLREEETAL